jgi:hypothetical protein
MGAAGRQARDGAAAMSMSRGTALIVSGASLVLAAFAAGMVAFGGQVEAIQADIEPKPSPPQSVSPTPGSVELDLRSIVPLAIADPRTCKPVSAEEAVVQMISCTAAMDTSVGTLEVLQYAHMQQATRSLCQYPGLGCEPTSSPDGIVTYVQFGDGESTQIRWMRIDSPKPVVLTLTAGVPAHALYEWWRARYS